MDERMRIEKLEARIDELDMFTSELMSQSAGSFLPTFAIAIALIDAGIITRSRLLEIVDAIIDYGATQVPAVGEEENFLDAAERLRMFLEGTELKAGNALDQIRLLSVVTSLQDLLRSRVGKPKREPPEDGPT